MGSWAVLWPNGDVSMVSARSKADAEIMLDGQAGDPSTAEWKSIPDGFFIDMEAVRFKDGGDIHTLLRAKRKGMTSESIIGLDDAFVERALKQRRVCLKRSKIKSVK